MLKGGILMLTDEFPPGPGGIGAYAYELAAGLHRLGAPIRVLCDSRKESSKSVAAFDVRLPFPVVQLPGKARGALAEFRRNRQLRKWSAAQSPGCLLSSGRNAAWLIAALARSQAIPYVAIGYGSEFLEENRRHLRRTQEAFARADAVVAISEFTAGLIARMGIERRKIRVVHPGADVCRELPKDSDAEALRRRLDLSGLRVILTVGRVSRRKAQDVVIRAMPEILRAVPDAVYVVAGIPAEREEFERIARSLGVADRVRFLGVAPPGDLPLLYRLADLFILNSRLDEQGNCEGFGIALVEAALACRPTMGTRGCGAEEAVEDGVTGILVDPDAPDQTARAAIRLLQDHALAERLGANGRRRALEKFSWDRAAQEMHDLVARFCLAKS